MDTERPYAHWSSQRIAYWLMRDLYRLYDLGGISCGRSRESTLLEPAMKLLIPKDEPMLQGNLVDLKIEAGRRNKVLRYFPQLLFQDLELLPTHMLGVLLLELLYVWYHNQVTGSMHPMCNEAETVYCILTSLGGEQTRDNIWYVTAELGIDPANIEHIRTVVQIADDRYRMSWLYMDTVMNYSTM